MPPPGVLAISVRDPVAGVAPDVPGLLVSFGVHDATLVEDAGLLVATWGGLELEGNGSLLLSRGPRRRERDLGPAEVADLLARRDVTALAEVLPPFAAFRMLPRGEAVAATDALGFRHVYLAEGDGWAALSTSARLLALLGDRPLDRDSVSLQSLLGWQVGEWTLFEGVTKLGAGALASLREGRLTVVRAREADAWHLELDEAVEAAADMLRTHLAAYVGDHPDATLQLTGGQDSRILLSAVPPELRIGLKAITLRVAGSPDADLAADLAARTGLRHHVEELDSLQPMDPALAHRLCLDASRRLEGMADPVALAGLTIAEQRFEQGHRIAGLGGEVARGFYYLGSPRDPAVTRARVARLTAWRMFANEAIDPAALSVDLRDGARERAIDRIFALMAGTGKEWLAATDDFYLGQRMQRWAGVTDTAVCLDRSVVNPMLDDRFIAIAQAMSPRSKRGSLFLARLQMALDPDLGRMPLDGRPPPEAYADPGLRNRVRATRTLARKAVAKARQRLGHSTRPPAGGAVLAAKVVEQWRREPGLLDGALAHGVLDEAWVEQMVSGAVSPAPSTVAFVLNLSALQVDPADTTTI
jgi:asparagine synthase (glutamine-hydrolysing)